ncbi:hypothetical protein [Pleomorphovibrio marinus]|uniref:hypothetical protein n=1 Tax=Pleomorphovibrio marinus TaxID=2164132 RepID=UPI000E0BDEB1|nr:hypothetical protein [Pleomorphovibrio marinus]
MTILSRIFGKKSTGTQQEAAVAPLERELFLEDRHPVELFPEKEERQGREEASILGDLLDKDYLAMGQRDGYEDRSGTFLEGHLEVIAADFRRRLYQAQSEIEHHMHGVSTLLTERTREHMPDQFHMLERKLAQLEQQQREVLREIDLAPMGQGYIEVAFRRYKEGFRKGFTLRMEEDILCKGQQTL